MALMRLEPQDKVLKNLTGTIGGVLPEAEEEKSVGYFDALAPAFRLENTPASVFSKLENESIFAGQDNGREEGYDVFEDLTGYEEYAERFIRSNNRNTTAKIKNKIDKENVDRETIRQAGFMGTLACMTAGIIDPINLIPFTGEVGAAVKGGSLLKSGLSTARAAALSITASEAALHATQETRTLGESAANITVGTFLGGIVGTGVAGLGKYLGRKSLNEAQFITKLEENLTVPEFKDRDLFLPNQIEVSPSAIEASLNGPIIPMQSVEGGSLSAAMRSSLGYKISDTYGLNNHGFDLISRVSNSKSLTALETLDQMVETPLRFDMNKSGNASGGGKTAGAVETRIKWRTQGLRYEAADAIQSSYIDYKGGLLKRGKAYIEEKLGIETYLYTYDEFKTEIAYAMRRGDQSNIAQVAMAAKRLRPIYDTLKNELIELGIFPKDVTVETAVSYLSRIWDKSKITENLDTVRSIFTKYIREDRVLKGGKALDDIEIQDVVQQILDNILNNPGSRSSYEPMPIRMRSGVIKTRSFSIPDEWVEPFLINDIGYITNRYIDSLIPDIELARKFGSTDLTDKFKLIGDEYQAKINAIKDTDPNALKEREALAKQRDSVINDLSAARDILRGQFGLGSGNYYKETNLEKWLIPVKTWNFVRFMGSYPISTMSDIGNLVIKNGLISTCTDTLIPMARNFASFATKTQGNNLVAKETKELLKDFGIGVEMLLNSRIANLADLGTRYSQSAISSASRKLNRTFAKGTLIPFVEDSLNTIVGYSGMARILKIVSKEKISAKDSEFLAYLGIGRDTARKIGTEFKTFGKYQDGVYSAGAQMWSDRNTYEAFGSALKKFTDVVRVNPGLDKPLAFYTPLGSTILQFKSYLYSAYNRLFLSNLQNKDPEMVFGLLTLTGLGMLSHVLKGRKVPESWGDFVLDGIDQSGIASMFMEANSYLETFSGGELGLRQLRDDKNNSKYYTRNSDALFFGPSLGLVQDVMKTTQSVSKYVGSDEPFKSMDVRAIRRLIPYQNHFLLRHAFNRVEEGLKDYYGINNRRTRN